MTSDDVREPDGGHAEHPDPTAPDGTVPSATTTRLLDRRGALLAGAAGVATLVASACQPAPKPPPPLPRTTSTTNAPSATTTTTTRAPSTTTTTTAPPPSGDEASYLHHARRLTFGPTAATLTELRSIGTSAWIDKQLNWSALPDGTAGSVAIFPRVGQSAAQILGGAEPWLTRWDMGCAALVRAVWSERQLYELLCDFWTNHLNVDVNHDPSYAFVPTSDREVIRRHATGRFADMLVASAKSGAMMRYLDLSLSRADGGRLPNENYARELMELHTVGVGGGYDEADIKEIAYLLSGWSLTDQDKGTFTFKSQWHNMGPLATGGDVLGWRPGSLTGQVAGESFLAHLARHPKTANRLAHKLAIRFISDQVKATDAVVTNAAKAYSDNDTAIAPMVRSLLTSAEFTASAGKKVRRPFEYLAACMRAARLQFDPAKPVDFRWQTQSSLELLGQVPYGWPAPNGYPDSNAKWTTAGAMVARWNLAPYAGVGFWLGAPTFDLARLMGSTPPATVGEAVDRLGASLLNTPLDAATRTAILNATGQQAGDRWQSWYNTRGLVGYILQTPLMQVR